VTTPSVPIRAAVPKRHIPSHLTPKERSTPKAKADRASTGVIAQWVRSDPLGGLIGTRERIRTH
jgi:hypothetical protein